MNTVGRFGRTRYRRLDRTGLAGYLIATAYNLVRIAKLRELAKEVPEAQGHDLTRGYPCQMAHEGRVREFEGPKVPFKRPNFLQENQGFTDLNARFWTYSPYFSSLLVVLAYGGDC